MSLPKRIKPAPAKKKPGTVKMTLTFDDDYAAAIGALARRCYDRNPAALVKAIIRAHLILNPCFIYTPAFEPTDSLEEWVKCCHVAADAGGPMPRRKLDTSAPYIVPALSPKQAEALGPAARLPIPPEFARFAADFGCDPVALAERFLSRASRRDCKALVLKRAKKDEGLKGAKRGE